MLSTLPLLAALLLPASLREALDKYDFGEMEAACTALAAMRDDPAFDTEARLKTLKFLGACNHVLGRLDASTGAFESLLDLDPRAQLDPVQFPPDMVRFFEDLKARHRPPPPVASPDPPPPVPAPVVEPPPVQVKAEAPAPDRSVGLALLPFGAGQFQNGHRTKGTVLATSQGLALAVGFTGLLLFEAEKDSGAFLAGGTFADPDRAEALQTVYLTGFVAFAALWAYGMYDSLVHLGDPAPTALVPRPGGRGLVSVFTW